MAPGSWTTQRLQQQFEQPFFNLIHQAYQVHQDNALDGHMEFCSLCSIKTGTCPEDCAYCPQSGHYHTGLSKQPLLDVEAVLLQAKQARAQGATRFCLGAAWRSPGKKEFPRVIEMIKSIKNLGLETCATLGMLDEAQAILLKEAGLDYYNHNIDTSPNYYTKIITTRRYQDRLDTIACVIAAGLNLCCGGIIGMGENRKDRIDFLLTLSQLPSRPQSIPINQLIPISGTPLEHQSPVDPFELIKTIAVTRIMFPQTTIRLSAGREHMSEETQAWCFMAGANSVFIGDTLLTADNPQLHKDIQLMQRLSLTTPVSVNG